MAFKLTVLDSVRMRKAILESVTTEVGLLPTDGVLGSFGGLVPGSRPASRASPLSLRQIWAAGERVGAHRARMRSALNARATSLGHGWVMERTAGSVLASAEALGNAGGEVGRVLALLEDHPHLGDPTASGGGHYLDQDEFRHNPNTPGGGARLRRGRSPEPAIKCGGCGIARRSAEQPRRARSVTLPLVREDRKG